MAHFISELVAEVVRLCTTLP